MSRPRKSFTGEDTTNDYLSPRDLLKLEIARERIQSAALVVGLKQMEARLDEYATQKVQLECQVKTLECALRQKEREKELQQLLTVQGNAATAYETTKAELGTTYGVNWDCTVYDDETGKLTHIPKET